jgi:branched-chain amino acid transport system ATP-binding protein
MSEPMLQVEKADVFYGASQILFGMDLSVRKGQVMALLGRNGAGKSTTFKAIAGLAPPRRGRILLRNEPVSGRAPYRIARAGIGFVPEDRQVFPDHSVHDNLLIGAKPGPGGERDWTIERIYDVFPLLASMRTRKAGRLSGGEQQMLTIARTLMGNPAILLLDEPSEGLAPVIIERMAEAIGRLKAEGLAILLSEQNLHFAQLVSDRATIIEKGRIRWSGTIPALMAAAAVREQYLSV